MMLKLPPLLITCLWLSACQSTPPPTQDWADFLGRIDRMDAQQLQLARDALLEQYEIQPTDSNRLRAAYTLSRPGASPEQLARGRELLAQIPPGSDLAPMRALLDREIEKSIEVHGAESQVLELQEQLSELRAHLGELQGQLDALKSIEEAMVESQQQADEINR